MKEESDDDDEKNLKFSIEFSSLLFQHYHLLKTMEQEDPKIHLSKSCYTLGFYQLAFKAYSFVRLFCKLYYVRSSLCAGLAFMCTHLCCNNDKKKLEIPNKGRKEESATMPDPHHRF